MDTGAVRLFSVAECLAIIKNSQNSTNSNSQEPAILSYGVEHGSSEMLGFTGEYYKLLIKLADQLAEGGVKHLRFFVKAMPRMFLSEKAETEAVCFFTKESRIYMDVLPHVQKYAHTKLYPKCLFTRRDVIVLEDLSAIPGHFKQTASKELYTLKHHHVVLEHLVKLHTASMAWNQAEGVDFGEQFKDNLVELQTTMKNKWYEVGIRAILYLAKRHPKLQSPEVKEFINTQLYEVLSRAEQLTKPSTKVCNVLCHRDTWDRNIFFQYDGEGAPTGCLLVDFQLAQYNSPTVDVNFLLYATTTRERRDEIYDELLDYYFETFQAYCRRLQLDTKLVKDQFLADNRRTRLTAIITMAMCEPLMKMPDGLALKMRAEEPQKFDHYMNCEREELFERVMAIDPTYEARIMAPIEELIMYLIANSDLIAMQALKQ